MNDQLTWRRHRRPRATEGRRAGVLAVMVLTLAALFAAVAPAADAHTALISSNPADDSVVAQPPTSIELVFSEDVKAFEPKVAITIADEDPVEIVPSVDGATVTADLTSIGIPGADDAGDQVPWRVGYRVVSADGHPISGRIDFSVGSGPAPIAEGDAATLAPSAGATSGSSAAAATGESGSGASATGESGSGVSASGVSESGVSASGVSESGVSAWWWIAGVGVVAVAVAVLVLALRRPRTSAAPPQ